MVRARILVTGSRTWRDSEAVRCVLFSVRSEDFFSDAVLVHGDCEGADRIAADIWRGMGCETEAHPAKWNLCTRDCKPGHRKFRGDGTSYCPTAGLRRNQEMVNLGADVVLAFWLNKSRGTGRTIAMAEDAGLHVVPIEAESEVSA